MFQRGNRVIWSGVVKIHEGVGNFLKFVSFEVGDGSKIRFWHAVWWGEQPLEISYSNLFSIAHCTDMWVEDHMQFQMEGFNGILFFTRPVQDWEVDLVSSFFKMLYSLKVRQEEVDRICRIPSKRHKFGV
jgi:hypothetical protein